MYTFDPCCVYAVLSRNGLSKEESSCTEHLAVLFIRINDTVILMGVSGAFMGQFLHGGGLCNYRLGLGVPGSNSTLDSFYK